MALSIARAKEALPFCCCCCCCCCCCSCCCSETSSSAALFPFSTTGIVVSHTNKMFFLAKFSSAFLTDMCDSKRVFFLCSGSGFVKNEEFPTFFSRSDTLFFLGIREQAIIYFFSGTPPQHGHPQDYIFKIKISRSFALFDIHGTINTGIKNEFLLLLFQLLLLLLLPTAFTQKKSLISLLSQDVTMYKVS